VPDDDENIILSMILQTEKENLDEKVDGQSLFKRCNDIKLNINKGRPSNHFQSVGGSFGVGACQKYFIKDNLASFGHFLGRKEDKNIFLEEGIIQGMSWAGFQLENMLAMMCSNQMLCI